MRKLFLALAATAVVMSSAAFTTRSEAMTLAVGSGLNAAIDTAGTVEPARWYHRHYRHHYRHHHYRHYRRW